MDEQKLLAEIGRLTMLVRESHTGHMRTLTVLRNVVSGQIPADRVKVTDTGWEVLPEEPKDGDE